MKRKTTYGIVALATLVVLVVGGVSAFGLGFGNGQGLTDDKKVEMQAFHEEVQTAIQNEDYNAWRTLMESQLTQENFEALAENHVQMQEAQEIREQMREARYDGDTETFEELRTQLQEMNSFGMGNHKMMGSGPGKGFAYGDCPYMDSD